MWSTALNDKHFRGGWGGEGGGGEGGCSDLQVLVLVEYAGVSLA